MHKAAAVAAAAVVAEAAAAAAAAAAALALVLSQTLTEVKTALHCNTALVDPRVAGNRIRLMTPGLNHLRETKMMYGRVLPTDRSDVQMCLSMIVSWIAMHTGFHFPLPSWS